LQASSGAPPQVAAQPGLAATVTIAEEPDGVAVLTRTDIPDAFRRALRTLTDQQVAALFGHARKPTTWVARPR
jgi:hypothetical protein